MIKHGIDVLKSVKEFLNGGQILVMAFDEPLLSLAKFVQWKWPEMHGEDKFIAMFGGLHIEMAVWKTFGDYLQESGWTRVLVQAGVATAGTADSFLKVSHLLCTRHAHQVTALTPAKLQEDTFISTDGEHTDATREVWRQKMKLQSSTFQF